MNRLLHANFTRLWKNKLFIIGLGFMFLAGSAYVLKQYEQLSVYGIPSELKSTFFKFNNLIGVLSAIFCSLFLGIEYSDGTIRNKIIVGHKRINIYISNLVLNITTSILFCVSYIIPNIFLGIPLLGLNTLSISKLVLSLLGSIMMVIALCALYTMIGLLFHNKAIAPVICIVAMFLSIGVVNEIKRTLDQPKYYYDGVRNDSYIEGAQRERYKFMYNFIPAGQASQYSKMSLKNIDKMCLYSAGITIVATGIGMFLFRKKDIK
jgi:hypothetical protein